MCKNYRRDIHQSAGRRGLHMCVQEQMDVHLLDVHLPDTPSRYRLKQISKTWVEAAALAANSASSSRSSSGRRRFAFVGTARYFSLPYLCVLYAGTCIYSRIHICVHMYIGMYTYSDVYVLYMCRNVRMKMYIYISSGVFYTYTNNTHSTLAHDQHTCTRSSGSCCHPFFPTPNVSLLQSESHCIDDSFYRHMTLQNHPPHSSQPCSCVHFILILSLSLSLSISLSRSRRIDAPDLLPNSASRDINSDLFSFVRHDLLRDMTHTYPQCVWHDPYIFTFCFAGHDSFCNSFTQLQRGRMHSQPMDSYMWRDSFCNSFTQLQLRLMKSYEVAAINRLPKNISPFCKRALQNRLMFCKRDLHVEGAC